MVDELRRVGLGLRGDFHAPQHPRDLLCARRCIEFFDRRGGEEYGFGLFAHTFSSCSLGFSRN